MSRSYQSTTQNLNNGSAFFIGIVCCLPKNARRVMKWGPSHKIVRPIVFPFAAQIYSAILHTKQRPRWCTDPASFLLTAAIQSGSRGARRYLSHHWTQGNVLWQRGGRGASPGLSSGRFVVADTAIYSVYRSDIGYTPSINRRSVLEAPLCFICIGYNWEPSDLTG